MTSNLYLPLNTLKAVADNIWVVDGPLVLFYGIAFPTRMTLVRLTNGDLWLHSPVSPDGTLLEKVDALGPVKYLIAPNNIHYLSVGDWKKLYPEAKVWTAPNVAERSKRFGFNIHIDNELGDSAPAEWQTDLDQVYVRGNKFLHEIDFFHRTSKTLILTDLIENFQPHKLPWYLRILYWLGGNMDPDGKAPLDMRLAFTGGKPQARKAVERMIAWAPDRIILSHGRWYDKNGTVELQRAFRWLLN